MPNVKLTLACWDYDRTRPLMDGRVRPEGIDLDIEILRPRQAFQRMLDKQEFQVSELSLASYAALKGRSNCPFVALPVALSKIFRHSCIYVRPDAGIRTPQDLKGKRVGVPVVAIIRFSDGKWQESWTFADELGMLLQLGAPNLVMG